MTSCSGEAAEDTFEWRVFVPPVKRMFDRPETERVSEPLNRVRPVLTADGLSVDEESEGSDN